MKIYKNVKLHRDKGTVYFRVANKNNFIMPFIQFSFKNMCIRPKVVSLIEGNAIGATWLIFTFGIISNINLEKEYNFILEDI